MENRARKTGVLLLIAAVLLTAALVLLRREDGSFGFTRETPETILLRVDTGTQPVRIHSFHDGETYHFFLPSGAEPEALSFDTRYGVTLQPAEGGEKLRYRADMPLGELRFETEYRMECRHGSMGGKNASVIFHRGENVASVHISTRDGDITPVLQDGSARLPGRILVTDPQCSTQYEGALEFIRTRGNTSWFFAKKPFKIKLEQDTDLLGLGMSREFCLLSQETDGTMLRNKIAFDLAEQVGLPYTPDSEFADLYIDGHYWGLYLVTDQIEISRGSVDIPDMSEEMKYLNAGPLSEYPHHEDHDMAWFDIPNNPHDITGGYLLEMDKFYYTQKPSRFRTDRVYYMTLKDPQYASREQVEYVRSRIEEMEDSLTAGNYQQIQKKIDEQSWVKMGVLQEVMTNYDFMGSSQYFYILPDSGGRQEPIYAGPLWDMDYTLQRFPPNVLMMSYQSWYKYLYPLPEFYQQVRRTYTETFRPMIRELQDGGIDAYADRIRASAAMEKIRWQELHRNFYGMENRFDQTFRETRDYFDRRIEFLDSLWIREENKLRIWLTRDVKTPGWYVTYLYRPGQPFEPPENFEVPDDLRFAGWYRGTPEDPGERILPGDPIYSEGFIFAKFEPASGQ